MNYEYPFLNIIFVSHGDQISHTQIFYQDVANQLYTQITPTVEKNTLDCNNAIS